jgi:transcription initiation factor TFIID subunit 5
MTILITTRYVAQHTLDADAANQTGFQFELNKFMWPLFVHSYLELVENGYPAEAKTFLDDFGDDFKAIHGDDLKLLSTIKLPAHVKDNETARLYKEHKYQIPVTDKVEHLVLGHLDKEYENGGKTLILLIARYCKIRNVDRGLANPKSFSAIFNNQPNVRVDEADLEEGIPGLFTGVRLNVAPDVPLKLGPLPMEPELQEEVRAEIEEEDRRHPPPEGRSTLLEEFDNKIKREESMDGPARADLPLPASRARDVWSEIDKIREHRDRFRIKGRSGGVGVAVSVCMYTFHNTLGRQVDFSTSLKSTGLLCVRSYNCIEFSNDQELVAVGTMDSYIRVWSMDGSHLKSAFDNGTQSATNNRMLIGHSAPVYGLSFSDAVSPSHEARDTPRAPRLLLSCSADGHIRLWSLDTWSCLCIYKSHDGPVFNVQWGPHGHYFASGGWDKTVRVWMQDHATPVRTCVGHDTSISATAWHPNGTYVFSASDETDKSIRMWSVITGDCVRIMVGHHHYINTIECAPNGKILASADIEGNIFWWDIEKGVAIKKSKGHGKGGITSLSFSVESNVLVSGGVDNTVRVWDVDLPADGRKPVGGSAGQAAQPENNANTGDSMGPSDRSITVGGQPQQPPAAATSSSAGGAASAGAGVSSTGTGKKKGKEVQISADQISAFPTKKTALKKVRFTRMNLVTAAGVYEPER